MNHRSIINIISYLWNSRWNPYDFQGGEKIVFWSLLMILLISFLTCLIAGSKSAGKIFCRLLLLFWLFTIVSATLIARKEQNGKTANLELFWTLRYALEHHSWRHWYYLIGNIALFVPLGVLLPSSFRIFQKWYIAIVVGCLVSLGVESAQYVWRLGLFELDDIVHNTWGTALGISCVQCIAPMKLGNSRPLLHWITSCAFLIGSITGLMYLLIVSQPDWQKIFLS